MRRIIHQRRGFFDYAVILLALSLVVWAGCDTAESPAPDLVEDVVLSPDDPQVRMVMDVQDRNTDDLMSRPGVVGTGTGLTEDGRPAIVVLVESEVAAKEAALPEAIDAVPVVTLVTGEIKALKGPPSPPVDHTARFDRPVPLGISTGHPSITAGTIGARVKQGNNVFALSNNHVYAASNAASIGDAVIQPGTFDGGTSPADNIGTLFDFEPIVFSTSANNVIDAAIASTTTALLDNTTTSDCYGTPKSTTITAEVNMKVMKCGRTTEFTTGNITAINATVNVNYGAPGVARFVDQIITTNISAGGDSGSLVVVQGKGKNKNDDRKPVGLLYAGSSSATILNPIGAVLTRFGVTIDGE